VKDEKFKRPTDEEIKEGHGYTPEDYEAMNRAREALQAAELKLRDLKEAWRSIAFGDRRLDTGYLLAAERAVSLARYQLRTQRKLVRKLQYAYWTACVPMRLRMRRAAKLMGSYIRERLNQESFAEKILPPVVLPPGNRHERRVAASKARKKT
jgi:hypothetical protein